jgi:hypothetical protein
VTPRLERRLGRSATSLALVGIGPQEERELLEEVRPALEGRLVLQFVFEGNDLLDSADWRADEDTVHDPEIGRGRSWTDRTLAHQIVLRLQAWTDPVPDFLRQRRGTIGSETYYFQWLRQSFEGLEDEIPFVTESLAGLRSKVEEAGARYVLVLVPSKIRVLGEFCRFEEGSEIADWKSHCGPLPGALRAWCERESIPFVDLTEPLRASARAGAVPWFPADTHWNSVGHAVAADALADAEAVRAWVDETDR